MPPIETFAKRKTVDLRGRRRLTTAQLAEVDQVGRHPLDDLLYFTVQKGGSRGYELRYLSPETGKRRDMAIGRFPETDPATARERAAEVRALIANNVDPLEERLREQERARSLQTHEAFTMRAALEAHFAIESLRWRNEKYTAQWLGRMFSALKPLLDRPLAAITKGELHDQLVAINRGSHDTAIKVRANLDKLYRRFAGMKGVPESHNPAATLVGLLPRTNPVRHHPALDWREAPAFVRRLRDSNAWISVRLGFEWLILSGGRTDAVTHTCWSQVHDASGYWRASPFEAENKRRGDVPLTPRMCEILDAMRPHRIPGADWIFPSPQRKARSTKRKERGHPPISNAAFRQVLCRMGAEVTGHGFRSTYKTWAMESPEGRALQLPEVIIEAALGHSERDAIRAAYTRADYWDARVKLALAWHDYLVGHAAQ